MDEYYAALLEYYREKAKREAEFKEKNDGLYLSSFEDLFIPEEPDVRSDSFDYGFFDSEVDPVSGLTFGQSFRATYGTVNYATGNKLPIKGPAIAAGFQITADLKAGYSFTEISGRALVVAMESAAVGFAAATAGAAVVGATAETGPVAIVYGAMTFYSVSVLMAPVVSGINEAYIFPIISDIAAGRY